MKEIGLYIHIPFCKKKCFYCDFISFSQKENLQEEYINVLEKEIDNWIKKNNNKIIKTIYIGGGTPSYIDSKKIMNILKKFQNKTIQDCTIEVNPGTVTEQKLKDYKNAGINRLSIGLQSTNNNLLNKIGRIHTYEDFLETYSLARKIGFENINVDLMIGLPSQTIKDIKKSIQEIVNLKPEHISVYSLIVEEETPIQKLINSGHLNLPSEDIERNMYWYVKNFLEINGYKHYEISNFAKSGYESVHNMDCWNQNEYIGFGISAHSYIDEKRFSNITNIEDYIKNIKANEFEKNIILEEQQSKEIKMNEYMLLGLRKIDGVSIQRFENKFNENPIILFKNQLNKLLENELVVIDGDRIKLATKGIDLANLVWEEFV